MGLTAEGTPVLQFLNDDGDPVWTASGGLGSSNDHAAGPPAPATPEGAGEG
jgi:hypothetical protein